MLVIHDSYSKNGALILVQQLVWLWTSVTLTDKINN